MNKSVITASVRMNRAELSHGASACQVTASGLAHGQHLANGCESWLRRQLAGRLSVEGQSADPGTGEWRDQKGSKSEPDVFGHSRNIALEIMVLSAI